MRKSNKRLFTVLGLLFMSLFVVISTALADKPTSYGPDGKENGWAKSSCPGINDGGIFDKNGNLITMGYDVYGYNYQAHMFNGYYDNFSRPDVPVTSGNTLIMKWSDAWLANVDCNGDGELDRGLVNGEVGGTSLGWLTNHEEGVYVDENGDEQHYTYFVKIVWTGPGSPLWGQYTVIQEVGDWTGANTGLQEKMPAPGFGQNDHWTTN